MPKPKIIVIVGPTASGKSNLAVKLAKRFDGEIISADSRQVYRGMNLGSGKIKKTEMKDIPHYLLDVTNPKKVFSVSDFQQLANEKLADILRRGKTPIIVGGTGFYVQSIVDNLVLPSVSPNPKLRQKLEKKSPQQLYILLKKYDPGRAKTIDQHNPHRLIRAIEIVKSLGQVPSLKKEQRYNALQIGILASYDELGKKILKRLRDRLKAGMVAEVKRLHLAGLSWKRLESFGLEYRYLAQFLQQKISRSQMEEKIVKESLNYAKRQMTWFKKDPRITWIQKSAEAIDLTKKFLQ